MSSLDYSIVIPVYKSGVWLDELTQRIASVFAARSESFEVILVNDASPDEFTWPKIIELSEKHAWVRGFDMLYNVGQFNAIICGIQQANGVLIITMDDDLQHPPEEIPKLIAAIHDNPEIICVMGQYETKKHDWYRNVGSSIFRSVLGTAYGMRHDIKTSSFRIMRRELAEAITRYRTARPLLGPMTVQLTRMIMNVPVAHHPRAQGRSGYSIIQLVSHTVDALVYKSTAPLRIFTLLGLFSAVTALVFGLLVLIQWSAGNIREPGYTSLILVITFFSGLVLVGVGVVGEYIARIIAEISGPASYQIRRST